MKITFEWTSGTASDNMVKALNANHIKFYRNHYMSLCVSLNDSERVLDYRHVSGDTYEIVEKVLRYRQEPEIMELDF